MINSDACSCCGEIWNREKLKSIPLGKHKLYLCPDCYAEYIKPLNSIRAEIRKKMRFGSFNEGIVSYDDISQIFDNYITKGGDMI